MPAAVVIAASNLMPALSARLADEGELLTFADTEPIQALQAILEKQPRLIVLERLFAATPRGAALINRIRTDPQVSGAEVRVMSHTGDYVRQVARPMMDAAASIEVVPPPGSEETVEAPPPPKTPQLDWRGTRRGTRHRMRNGLEIQLDGNPVLLVDLSTVGAQVVSATILRPNQRVRVSMPTDNFMMRFRGTIAWAKFELPKPTEPPRYRAGVEFTDADSAAITSYCNQNKA